MKWSKLPPPTTAHCLAAALARPPPTPPPDLGLLSRGRDLRQSLPRPPAPAFGRSRWLNLPAALRGRLGGHGPLCSAVRLARGIHLGDVVHAQCLAIGYFALYRRFAAARSVELRWRMKLLPWPSSSTPLNQWKHLCIKRLSVMNFFVFDMSRTVIV